MEKRSPSGTLTLGSLLSTCTSSSVISTSNSTRSSSSWLVPLGSEPVLLNGKEITVGNSDPWLATLDLYVEFGDIDVELDEIVVKLVGHNEDDLVSDWEIEAPIAVVGEGVTTVPAGTYHRKVTLPIDLDAFAVDVVFRCELARYGGIGDVDLTAVKINPKTQLSIQRMAMAKPTAVATWATSTTYSSGVLTGAPTKIVPPEAYTAEGYVPIVDFAPVAQYENWVLNNLCEWAQWTEDVNMVGFFGLGIASAGGEFGLSDVDTYQDPIYSLSGPSDVDVSETGVYEVTISIDYLYSGGGGNLVEIEVHKNGAQAATFAQGVDGNLQRGYLTGTAVIDITSGDLISISNPLGSTLTAVGNSTLLIKRLS